nr:hypothetical protein [Tanacetum cinerariifolium]
MLAIPDEHLLKFHAYKDVKSLWEAIKNSTNETVNTAHSVSAANSKNQASTTLYANDIMFSFFSNQSSAPQFDNEDLEQIDTNDLEDMDFKWQVAMLTMRVKRFIKNTGRKLDLNRKDTVGFDRTKVKCYNFHRRSHFAKECRAPRNKRNKNRNAPTRNAPVDTSTTNDLVVQDGIVSPPYTGNYMPPRAELSFAGLDDSVFKSKVSETITGVPKIETNASKTSKDSLEKPKTIRSSAPIIEDWETNSEDEHVFEPKEVNKTVKPSLEKIEIVNARNTTVENENKAKKPKKVATLVSTAKHVNTAASRPNVNNALPTTYYYFKAHSPVRRPFNQKSAAKTNNFNEKVNTAKVNNVTTAGPKAVVSTAEGNMNNADQGIFDIRCSIHMTANKSYLSDYQKIDGGFVAFGGNAKGCKITGKGKIKTRKLDFKDVYFVKELKFNLLSLLDESQVLLKVPRNNNMHSFDLKNGVPIGGLTCLFVKATLDESNLWHRRLGHINFKTINKLVKGNLVRGLPSNLFENDHTCVACQKEKQHKASRKQTNSNAGPNSFDDEVSNDAGKKSIEVLRKENGVQDPAKEGDKNNQEKDVRDQEEALRKQFEQESERLFGQGKAANTNSTNRLNIVSSPINVVSSSFTTVDPKRERAQRNEFESMFGQDKDANGNKIFNPVSAAGSTYVYLDGSIRVNASTLLNANLPTDPLMPDLEDTADL